MIQWQFRSLNRRRSGRHWPYPSRSPWQNHRHCCRRCHSHRHSHSHRRSRQWVRVQGGLHQAGAPTKGQRLRSWGRPLPAHPPSAASSSRMPPSCISPLPPPPPPPPPAPPSPKSLLSASGSTVTELLSGTPRGQPRGAPRPHPAPAYHPLLPLPPHPFDPLPCPRPCPCPRPHSRPRHRCPLPCRGQPSGTLPLHGPFGAYPWGVAGGAAEGPVRRRRRDALRVCRWVCLWVYRRAPGGPRPACQLSPPLRGAPLRIPPQPRSGAPRCTKDPPGEAGGSQASWEAGGAQYEHHQKYSGKGST